MSEKTIKNLDINELGAQGNAGAIAFIAKGLVEMCDSEEILASALYSIIITLAVNKAVCPACFHNGLGTAITEIFDIDTDEEGEHTVNLKSDKPKINKNHH